MITRLNVSPDGRTYAVANSFRIRDSTEGKGGGKAEDRKRITYYTIRFIFPPSCRTPRIKCTHYIGSPFLFFYSFFLLLHNMSHISSYTIHARIVYEFSKLKCALLSIGQRPRLSIHNIAFAYPCSNIVIK